MLTFQQILGFLAAAILITASPGPDNLMVLGMGISKGRKHGIAFGLGCAAGCISHTVLAVVGVSALVAASPLAFTALKVVGGLYLVWMGWNAWRHAGAVRPGQVGMVEETLGRLFVKGMMAASVNPKVILFFLSFLPQFVVAGHGHVAVQLGALGLLFAAQAAVLFGLIGYFSGAVGQWLTARPQAGPALDRLAGTIFIGLGLRLIVSR